METFTHLSESHGGLLFSLFYLAAFIVMISLMLIQGIRRKYPVTPWILIITFSVLFLVLGSKLFTYAPEQIKTFITGHPLTNNGCKTMLGAIAGGMAGAFLAKMLLRFRYPFIDMLAGTFPLAMAIQRMGCLFAGCCYGQPTTLPWGISYGVHSHAYHAQLMQGLIQPGDLTSLPVHPTQLYDILLCLSIAIIIYMARKRWTVPGNKFLFAILLYASGRFLNEFLRDPGSNLFYGEVVHGFKYVQWILLLAILLLTLAIVIRKMTWRSVPALVRYRESTVRNSFVFLLTISVIYLGRNWFSAAELIILVLVVLPAIVLMAWQWNRRMSVAGLRWIPAAACMVYFVFTGQKAEQKDPEKKSSYMTIGVDGMFGKFDYTVKTLVRDECGDYMADNYTRLHKYYAYGISYSYNLTQGKYRKDALVVRLHYGQEDEFVPHANKITHRLFGITPFYQFDSKWIGFGLGLNAGKLRYAEIAREDAVLEVNDTYINPLFNVRVGTNVFYAVYRYSDNAPSSSPFPRHKIGLGSGAGKTDGTTIEAGLSDINCHGFPKAVYFYMLVPVKNKYEIMSFVSIGQNEDNNRMNYQVAFGLHYQFNKK
ncbi:MAG: prolipoprotein diacylglyceryl transferase [Bacteroidetes bacterium]|nr:prolipoprotein diacylglyceryl transferase [Bacteroidota bacterium]